MSRVLDVYFHEVFVGQLIQGNSGELSFQYDEAYVAENNLPSISLSMPVRSEVYDSNSVKAFFSGLLPDDIARQRLARYLGVSEKNPFALLEVIGGECAGALSFYSKDEKPPVATADNIEKLD